MHPCHRGIVLACFLACTAGLGLSAQEQPPKTDPKAAPEKSQPTLDKLKLPDNALIVLYEEIKNALNAKMILVSPEKYQEWMDHIAKLERQLKAEKKLPSSCKLSAKADGDTLLLSAKFEFVTEQPHTRVVLGLQGAYLVDEGSLDGKTPTLEYADEGLLVKVDQEGRHELSLNLKVPISLRRTGSPGGGTERVIDLGLPGAAVTTLALTLPQEVKEIRWNDHLALRRESRWELALGSSRNLALAWKEPVAPTGAGPMRTVDSQVAVRIDETQALVSADLVLEDLLGPTPEWQLWLPEQARVEARIPGGGAVQILPPGKSPYFTLQPPEGSTEPIKVTVTVRYPRPFVPAKLPIGPFVVQGAAQQNGTITVYASAEAIRGQRLVFHKNGEIFQRELPKAPVGRDVAALFQYWSFLPGPKGKGPAFKAPLEIELKAEKGQVETAVEHQLQLSPSPDGWQVDSKTKITATALYTGVDYLDVVLPPARPLGVDFMAGGWLAAFPGNLPWPALGRNLQHRPIGQALEFSCEEDAGLAPEMSPPDGQRKSRIKMHRLQSNKKFTVVLTGRYLLPAGAQRARIELPRPVGVLDRGAKVTIQAGQARELLVGEAGNEEPAPEIHRLVLPLEQAPATVDVAWRPYRPDFPVYSIADITFYRNHAGVLQQLAFTYPLNVKQLDLGPTGQMRLRVPPGIQWVKVNKTKQEVANGVLWLKPPEAGGSKETLVLEYDFPLPAKMGEGESALRAFEAPLLTLEQATRIESKVRLWSNPGTVPVLAENHLAGAKWKDMGAEVVPGQSELPALVLQAAGLHLTLPLRLLEPESTHVASVVLDRGLVQVQIDEEGNHVYRARYLVSKFNTRAVEIELPAPTVTCLPRIILDRKQITNWVAVGPSWNRVRIPVEPRLYDEPVILEVDYHLPAVDNDGERYWQSVLHPPVFLGEVWLGRVRWQVGVPPDWVGTPLGSHLFWEYRWGLRGGLLGPVPGTSVTELESWLTGREPADAQVPLSLTFRRSGQEVVRVFHLPQFIWLSICSGLLMAVGLLLAFASLPRLVFWLVGLAVAGSILSVGLYWPTLGPLVVMGCQPGMLVLLLILGLNWMLQERQRRQLAILPGFARVKSNSSLVRSGSSNRPREPSTIDSPAATGSGSPGNAPGIT